MDSIINREKSYSFLIIINTDESTEVVLLNDDFFSVVLINYICTAIVLEISRFFFLMLLNPY